MAHEMNMKNGRPAEAGHDRGEDPDRELAEEEADDGTEEVS